MTTTDPAVLRELWRRVPVDDVGYLVPDTLLAGTDGQLLALVDRMATVRYQGWRNHQGRYRDVLGLDTTHGAAVLDYGCGVGLDALQYAKAGNDVVVADLHLPTVQLALRVLASSGTPALSGATITPAGDLDPRSPAGFYDVVHLSGVLHHLPNPGPVLHRCRRWLKPDGELRLLLYSDHAWRLATGTDPPTEVLGHPAFDRYVDHMDMAGGYADWYDPARLATRTRDWFRVLRCEYAGPDQTLLLAVLGPR